MIVRRYPIDAWDDSRLSYIGPKERLIFFDIETTGLKAGRAEVYLIGALCHEKGRWELIQWFSEELSDEERLLSGFCELVAAKKRELGKPPILVSYNGDGFDLPFLSGCLRAYGHFDVLKTALSFDIYKHIRWLRGILGLSDMKLKTVEGFLSIGREDKYSGGELISVYQDYRSLKTSGGDGAEGAEELLRILLLHNAEDISYLPRVAEVLSYEALFSGGFELSSADIVELSGSKVLDLRLRLELPLPKEFIYEEGPYAVSASGAEGELLNITAELYSGELKYFFADYKNYYYLPLEDRAIHKSVGEFVEKSSRQRAKRENCYQCMSGIFLPEPENVFAPVYHRSYGEKSGYALFSEELLSDKEELLRYAKSIMEHIKANLSAKR
ncbi:MAG TPA: ribonuclease H-like domain-containing protein [Candidatus Avilachnospira avistercoris]|nr:ribonuclease H-like domain-containing protein [Candidatus Avilachnospira avistercoris]